MPRARTGQLLPPGPDGLWRGRISKDEDGTTTRPIYTLGTTDKALAKRKLAKLVRDVAAGLDVEDQALTADAPETVKEYAKAWLEKREAQGISMAPYERANLKHHALDAIGRLPLCDVTSSHVRSILDDVVAKGLKRGTVEQVRGVLHRLFDDAWRAEIIEANPVARVKVPQMRETKKERIILTDEEFARFVACPDVDLELRMLSLAARCEGGMRAGDLNAWDWTQIDRANFAECFVPRAKTRTPQRLGIPDTLAPFLRAWWERAGKPESGAVFPCRLGPRAGEFKAKKGAYAHRLRRDLAKAGVFRVTPIVSVRQVRTGRGTNTRAVEETNPDPRDPLYFETSQSLPVDFHSFRRAFNTALAEAGVNVQHAMHLASHSDAKVHQRYVMSTTAMRAVPPAALPQLTVAMLTETAKARAPEAPKGGGRRPPAAPAGSAAPAPTETTKEHPDASGKGTGPAFSTAPTSSDAENVNDIRAGHGIRTRDIQLGKLALYQLS
jgi:integrase